MTDDASTKDRAALVTGAARRVGAALARALAEDGWHVLLHCHSSTDDAERLLRDIRATGGSGEILQADLSDPAAVEDLIATLPPSTPPLRCLVNNASLFSDDSLASLTAENWLRHQQVNLLAPLVLSRAFAARVPEDQQGCIVNLLDNKVFALNPDYFSYTLSKVGLHGATRMLAMELAPRVRVCGIAPGITLPSGDQSDAEYTEAHRRNPLRQGCTVEDIARALRFILATPAMTGEVITIDGGQHLMRDPRDVAYL